MKEDRVYLLHIRDALLRIFEYTTGGEETFFSDTKTQDAVVRNLEIIGEAVKNISDDLRNVHAEILWKRIAGMRDKMIHEYFGVNLRLVFDVVHRDLPELKQKIEAILNTMETLT